MVLSNSLYTYIHTYIQGLYISKNLHKLSFTLQKNPIKTKLPNSSIIIQTISKLKDKILAAFVNFVGNKHLHY